MKPRPRIVTDANTTKFLLLSAALVFFGAVLLNGCTSDQATLAPESLTGVQEPHAATLEWVPADS